jgi:hypothetical protein
VVNPWSPRAALPGWLDAANLVASAFDGAVKPFLVWDILKMAFAALYRRRRLDAAAPQGLRRPGTRKRKGRSRKGPAFCWSE